MIIIHITWTQIMGYDFISPQNFRRIEGTIMNHKRHFKALGKRCQAKFQEEYMDTDANIHGYGKALQPVVHASQITTT